MDSEASLRGYSSPKRLRSQRARKAGLASGRRRRDLAGPHKRRVRQRELALKFPIRLVDRAEFDRLDFARRLQHGIEPNERGTETLWRQYQADVRTYKVKGQGFLTTNGQRAEALRKGGLTRCERTVQRSHAILAEMGLLRRFHDRRGGARAGNRDRLRVQFAPSYVTPPSAAPTTPSPLACVGASRTPSRADSSSECAADGRRDRRPATPARIGPPFGGSDRPPAAPAGKRQQPGGGSAEAGDAIAFLRYQLELPPSKRCGSPDGRVLESRLRQLELELE